jgi:hypothetical protein
MLLVFKSHVTGIQITCYWYSNHINFGTDCSHVWLELITIKRDFCWGKIHHSVVLQPLLEVSLTTHPYDAVVDMTMFQLHVEEYSSKSYSFSATQDTPRTLWKQNAHYCLQKSLPLVPNLSKMTVLQTADKSPNLLLTIHIYYPKDKSVMNITWHKIDSGTCIMHCYSLVIHHFTPYKQHCISHLHKSVKEPDMVVKIML